ncbi:MAG: hypothetical protein O7E51_10290 [Acidobacteria bacterium]|nr:hypothetical protein [Acidobacteriota bacterium]
MASKNYVDASKNDSVGSIEIIHIHPTFYTASFGDPSVLFPLLLASAREAYAATTGDAEQKNDATAHRRAATYMAGLLVCDETFLLRKAAEFRGHRYTLDFSAGTIQLCTHVYTAFQQSVAFFNIRIKGPITGSTFVVSNTTTDRVLAQVSEDELKKPNFFTEELPFVCSQTQNDPALVDSIPSLDLIDKNFELWLPIDHAGSVRTVVVSKEKGEGQGRVQDPVTRELLCMVPLDSFNDLETLLATLPTLLGETKPVTQSSP